MDTDEFWRLIEQSGHAAGGKRARAAWLQEALKTRSAEDILDFESYLLSARRRVDTWLMWGAMRALFGFGSGDDFWYFQMWLVGLGREVFEQVAHDPDALVDVREVQRLVAMEHHGPPWKNDDWPTFEILDYVAGEAWEHVTGDDRDGFYDALRARGHEISALPCPSDEDWELDDEEESARRLPRINRYMRELYGCA
ncbi:DUF4240 domain-containing protein [Nonomuraea mesophila]|uniref:DUF4240 domain-containing protein n=1 Tax=Nonomuraea mesophila TaxID=2530382 RepID=A0A4V2ZBC8_9ACTN|nr:DUF4240 domain-containing protein [Nonomuraea mesophila]TDE56410.1 DUF4240 domain-containing protein [Nonomuraea mesophila]